MILMPLQGSFRYKSNVKYVKGIFAASQNWLQFDFIDQPIFQRILISQRINDSYWCTRIQKKHVWTNYDYILVE